MLINNKIKIIFVSICLMVAYAPMSYAAQQEDTSFSEFQDDLDDLDARIQEHLKRARESSFWKPGIQNSKNQITPKPKVAEKKLPEAPIVKSAPIEPAVKQKASKSNFNSNSPEPAITPASNIAARNTVTPGELSGATLEEYRKLREQKKQPVVESKPLPVVVAVTDSQKTNILTKEIVTEPVLSAAKYAPKTNQPKLADDMASLMAPKSAGMDQDLKQVTLNGGEDDGVTGTNHVNVSGIYRMAAGVGRNRSFSVNDSNSDLQDRDFHYLFGERLNNTYDPSIYSKYELNIDADLSPNVSFFTQLVADPWSYVGRTAGIQVCDDNDNANDCLAFEQKYIGANNSTIGQIVRSTNRNSIALPSTEINGGKTQAFSFTGFDTFPNHDVPEQDIDFEFRPLRKMWADFKGDVWHARVFAAADHNQAMITDDPLGLSGYKDYWQHSAWVDEWQPTIVMEDATVGHAIVRGHYDDGDAFNAKDSSGNYLTLLRGMAFEADLGRTYIGGMLASKWGPWDNYEDSNNMPGVLRMKHQLNPRLSLGALYGFRVGYIEKEPDSYNQVGSVDIKYQTTPTDYFYAQAAGSIHELDRLSEFEVSGQPIRTDYEGRAYRVGFNWNTSDKNFGMHQVQGDFAWMDRKFFSSLSKYDATRDDEAWGNQITWAEFPNDVKPFKIGTGLDRGRYAMRLHVDTATPDKRFEHLFDMRHVRRTDSNSFVENVMRSEMTYQINPTWTAKSFYRWHQLPNTQSGIEPFLGSFSPAASEDPDLVDSTFLQNLAIEEGKDPSRHTLGFGLKYEPRYQWTFEGAWSRSNEIQDFPRGLQDGTFLTTTVTDPDDPQVNLDRVQQFLYSQYIYGLPPYDYFHITKERVIYKPNDNMQFIFHAAQNSNRLWGPIDENFNHQGISWDWQINDRLGFFFDYTHSLLADIPRFIATANNPTPELNFNSHHNVYGRLKLQLNQNAFLNMEYGVFGNTLYGGSSAVPINAFAVTNFSLPTIDTEHLLRVSLEGEF
ncbi:MAG: hypothetical protein ACI9CF_001663 [Candidatus Omnitrophota bacterium]|jgi:hypothetical protein